MRTRQQDQVIELVVAIRRAGHGAAVEQRAHGGRRLVHPVQALADPAAELDAVGLVLRVEPGAADAQDRPPVAQVVQRGGQLGRQPRVAERVGADQQAKPHALGGLGPRGEAHPSLEDRLQWVAEDRVQVVPRPQVVVAELVHPSRGVLVRRPVGGLVPQQHAEPHIGHQSVPFIRSCPLSLNADRFPTSESYDDGTHVSSSFHRQVTLGLRIRLGRKPPVVR